MAFKIKAKKVNRKFLFNAIKAQQLRINNLHEILASAKTSAEKQADEFKAVLDELKPVIDERNALRNVIAAMLPQKPESQLESRSPQPESEIAVLSTVNDPTTWSRADNAGDL